MNTAQTTGTRVRDDVRVAAGWGLGLLLPMVFFCSLVAFTSERAGGCLTYGEDCPAVPGWLLYGSFWVSLVAGGAALVWPRARWTGARIGAVLVQWGAQLLLAALILSYA
ncbi:hypothetical protein ABZ923_13715 [Streptomyces sp. NPDC046881]|uniref:hypothetical protein n=1 Tax=Streptomyces sp. NPDC046881 TaxID=3155374 RepID=UPI0033FF0A28